MPLETYPTLEERWDAQLNLCCGSSITVLAAGCHQLMVKENRRIVRHLTQNGRFDLFLRGDSRCPAPREVTHPVVQLELFFELRVGDFDLDAAVGAVLALV